MAVIGLKQPAWAITSAALEDRVRISPQILAANLAPCTGQPIRGCRATLTGTAGLQSGQRQVRFACRCSDPLETADGNLHGWCDRARHLALSGHQETDLGVSHHLA